MTELEQGEAGGLIHVPDDLPISVDQRQRQYALEEKGVIGNLGQDESRNGIGIAVYFLVVAT